MEEQKTFEQFKQETLRKKPKANRVQNSWGVYNCYKSIRKHGWFNIGRPVTEKEFYAIIRGVNDLLAEEIARGETVKFPERMGKLELRKYECGAFVKDGKLKVTYPVDWSETLKLWYRDEEAKRQKTLLRNENPFIYHVVYCAQGENANYENKCFYQFALNTFVKKALSRNIKQGKIDTLW